MKEKLKNYFNKDRIFVFICLLCIIAFCVLYAILYCNDKKQVSENESTIILNEDENNLNKSWSINQDGNLVGYNLLMLNNLSITTYNNLTYYVSNQCIYLNGYILEGEYPQLFNDINIYLESGTYTISKQPQYTSIYMWLGESVYNPNSIVNSNSSSYTFEISTSGNYYFNIVCTPNNTFNNSALRIMLNKGSIPLEWEPYGVWYSENNYDNLETQLDIISGNINPLSINNISSNSLILNSVDVTSQLQGSIFLSDLNGGIGFYNYDFDAYSSFNDDGVNEFNLVSIFNNTYTIYGVSAFVSLSHSADDYLTVSLYRDNQLILLMNDLDSETTQEYMQTYSNQEIQFNKIIISGQYTSGVSNRQGTNYIVDNNNYAFGYQQGYKDSSMYYDAENTRLVGENAQLNNDLNNLDAQYTTLSNNYSSLLEQYNLLNSDKYTFTELFWSISAVPFGVLTSGFNVNVLGFNLAAIITGLFTSLLLIWLIKKFFK